MNLLSMGSKIVVGYKVVKLANFTSHENSRLNEHFIQGITLFILVESLYIFYITFITKNIYI